MECQNPGIEGGSRYRSWEFKKKLDYWPYPLQRVWVIWLEYTEEQEKAERNSLQSLYWHLSTGQAKYGTADGIRQVMKK